MARQRHWVNRGGPGDCIFATTTVLDFVHAFGRHEPRDAMRDAILSECRRSKAVLHAFVVMPHHIHLVVRMPADRGPASFMHRLKLSASARVAPLLEPEETSQFSDQAGLNGNRFWQRSCRGKVVARQACFTGRSSMSTGTRSGLDMLNCPQIMPGRARRCGKMGYGTRTPVFRSSLRVAGFGGTGAVERAP